MTSQRAERAGTTVETLRRFLTEMELKFKEEPFPEGTAFRIEMDEPTPVAIARVLVDKERFTVHFYFPNPAPPESRMKVAEFITRANYGLVVGNFEMSFANGTIRFKTGIDFTNNELTERLIGNAVLSSMESLEPFSASLKSVIAGDMEPEAAFAAAMTTT